MISYLSHQNPRNIHIEHASPCAVSKNYVAEREKVWVKKKHEALLQGKTLWNGEVYTMNEPLRRPNGQLMLKLGTCAYKDIIFRIHHKDDSEFAILDDASFKYITLCCIPITTDDRGIFGVCSGTASVAQGSLSLIGGTLNKDEMEIASFEDFFEYMHREIEEESAITSRHVSLKLFSLNSFKLKYEFLFSLRLPIHSREISHLNKKGEFSHLVAMNSDELKKTKRPKTEPFLLVENYFSDLVRNG